MTAPSSVRGFWSRAARPVVALSVASGFVLAVPFMAVPASAAPAPAVPFANPAHHHAAVAPATSAVPSIKAAPAVPAGAPVHTFHPVASASDAPQDPGKLGSGQCYSTNPSHNCTLRAAVMEANYEAAYIAIVLSSGTYHLTIPPANTTDASTGNLDITDPQTVTFTGAGITHTFVDATGMGDRVFQLRDHGVARMSGFTIQNGNAANTSNNTDPGNGGGIDVSSQAASLVLTSMRIRQNTAASRGGGVLAQGALWGTDSQLTGNQSGDEGGGLFVNNGSVQLVNVAVTGNTAPSIGGGIDVVDGPLDMQGGSISGNHVVVPDGGGGSGGGIFVDDATSLVGTTIADNTIGPATGATSGSAEGGGVYVSYGLNRADRLTIRGNTVSALSGPSTFGFGDAGAGIYDSAGFDLTNSVITGNKALDGTGGGIFNDGSVEHLTHVTVSGNQAAVDGGGIDAYDITYISQSVVTNNTAGRDGGGIWSDDGQNITQSLIAGNNAVHGAGIYVYGYPAQLTNDTLTGNVASGTGNAGGALYTVAGQNSSAQLTNVTIAGNRSDDGGGIASFGAGVAVHNTIISANRAVSAATDTNCDTTVPITDSGNNIDSGHTCGLNGPGSRSNTNPKLGPLANNGGPTKTMALLSGSPAINHGSSPAPGVDQRGVKRGAQPDIGAFEIAGDG